jgi:hypothetical protein
VPPAAVRLAEAGTEAIVTEVRGAPAGAELVVDAGAPLALWLPVAEMRERGIEGGSRVTIKVDAERIAWLERDP